MKCWEKTLRSWGTGGLVIMYAEGQNVEKLKLNFGVIWLGWNLKDVSMRNRVTRKDGMVEDE